MIAVGARPASSTGTSQIRFLGGKLGQAIADKFEASTVGDLLYESTDFEFVIEGY